MSEIILGRTYKDSATGFEGVATGVTHFLFACERVCLSKGHNEKGEPIEAVFDAPQLVETKKETKALLAALTAAGLREPAAAPAAPRQRTGGDRPMPSAVR